MTKVIIALMLMLQGCSLLPYIGGANIYPNDHLVKLSCDGGECELRTNILICDDENIYCENINVPLIKHLGVKDE